MNEGQLPLLLSFMTFTIVFMGVLGVLCSKYIKQRAEIDRK
jgi:hypothetical protein